MSHDAANSQMDIKVAFFLSINFVQRGSNLCVQASSAGTELKLLKDGVGAEIGHFVLTKKQQKSSSHGL